MFKFLLSKMQTPRWVVFLIDTCIISVSILASYLLRFNFDLVEIINQNLGITFAIIVPTRILSFVISKTYSGLVRYTSTKDAMRISITIITGSVFAFTLSAILTYAFGLPRIPLSIAILDCIIAMAVMIISRFVVKSLYLEHRNLDMDSMLENVVIYGASESALTTKRTLDRDAGSNYKVVAFIDSDDRFKGKSIDGVKIYKTSALEEIIEKHNVKSLIFANDCPSKYKKNAIIELCLNHNIKVMSTPTVNNWINGELSFKQIKNIKIEDLLERDPIQLEDDKIRMEILNKTILVTGAAGSIGSEIVRQLTRFNPKKIIVFDQAESPLYDLELELREKLNFENFEIVIGDITDKARLTETFEKYRPEAVYHAAAYKHVPMMENNPSQAVANNVKGTKYLADFSVKYNVQKFVMVSTDKAVNPTNVMGCSKRICEIYTQSLNSMFQTKFITTRFGNVLGSNGSVIPRFKAQIEKGGPVTVTHPEITRFFMTIPEACQLVLQAGTLGNGGEIFVFDMGKSVKIIDLAKKMIKLSGLSLGKDIQIAFTGLRPGEKLYEEVLNDKEKTLPTTHSQIMVAKVREYDFSVVSEQISELIALADCRDNMKIVAMMKRIVPEFKSENSVYEELDNLNAAASNNAAELDSNLATEEKYPVVEKDFQKKSRIVYSNKKGFPIGKKFSLIH